MELPNPAHYTHIANGSPATGRTRRLSVLLKWLKTRRLRKVAARQNLVLATVFDEQWPFSARIHTLGLELIEREGVRNTRKKRAICAPRMMDI